MEKNVIVNGSTCSGKVLLFTRIFGRGTDFVVHDENVTNNGGVHVIQTFLSEELSEEIQIKGRTARQGDEGSYSMNMLKIHNK
jgi:preprotein translocase subunit SecA